MDFRSLIPFGRAGVPAANDPDPFGAMRREMDRMFGDFGRGFGALPSVWGGNGAKATIVPRVDVKETDKAYEVAVELPGVDQKDVTVELKDDMLIVSGEKKVEKEEKGKDKSWHVVERAYGAFTRAFEVPRDIDGAKVAAHFDKGVLTVTLPKSAEQVAKTKKIEIKAA